MTDMKERSCHDSKAMTLTKLRKICLSKGGYDTPELNDCLYLNFEGFTRMNECIQSYFNVKSLFLEGNCISKIENIEKLTELRALCINNNMLSCIENLDYCVNLRTLNLSNNHIKVIRGISQLKCLDTLNIQGNIIETMDDVKGVLECPSISTLELSNNHINDCEIINLLSNLPNLRSLYLKGNPFLNKMEFYRKNTIGRIDTLTFLDDRPIFDNERRLNNAWIKGGRDGETSERKLMALEKQQQKQRKMEARRLAQQRYQARVHAMQQRLLRDTINENQVYSNNNEITTVTNNNIINNNNINVINTGALVATGTDEKDAESDSKSETSDSWMAGSLDGESINSYSALSGFTDQELERHYSSYSNRNQHGLSSSSMSSGATSAQQGNSITSSELGSLSQSVDQTQMFGQFERQLEHSSSSSIYGMNGNDMTSERSESADISDFSLTQQSATLLANLANMRLTDSSDITPNTNEISNDTSEVSQAALPVSDETSEQQSSDQQSSDMSSSSYPNPSILNSSNTIETEMNSARMEHNDSISDVLNVVPPNVPTTATSDVTEMTEMSEMSEITETESKDPSQSPATDGHRETETTESDMYSLD